jgi:hypothetical protein
VNKAACWANAVPISSIAFIRKGGSATGVRLPLPMLLRRSKAQEHWANWARMPSSSRLQQSGGPWAYSKGAAGTALGSGFKCLLAGFSMSWWVLGHHLLQAWSEFPLQAMTWVHQEEGP